jgi:hypothetical protein
MKREFRWSLLLALILVASGLACGLLSRESEESGAPAQTQAEAPAAAEQPAAVEQPAAIEQPAAAELPAAEQPAPAAAEAQPAAEEPGTGDTAETGETLNLESISGTLADLSSYRTLLTVQAHDGTTVSVAEGLSSNPAAQSVEVDITGASNVAGALSTKVITVDNVTYTVFNNLCAAAPVDLAGMEINDPFVALAEPDNFVGSIAGARRVMPNQIVNGVTARRYVFDSVTVQNAHFQFSSVAGELFIAEEGDYVVRYTVQAQGRSDWFGSAGGPEGPVQVTYDVTDANKTIDIAAPAVCAGAALLGGLTIPGLSDGSLPGLSDGSLPGLPAMTPPAGTDWIWAEDDEEEETASPGTGGTGGQAATPGPPARATLPRLPDAYNLVSDAAGNETYRSRHSLEDAVAFYRREMAAQGWSIQEEANMPIFQTLIFNRAGTNLRVTITRDHHWDYTNVVVNWP